MIFVRNLSHLVLVYVTLVVVVLPGVAHAEEVAPGHFYQALAHGIDNVQAHGYLYFREGVFEARGPGANRMVWRIDQPDTRAEITVNYQNGALVTAELQLNHRIHVWPRGTSTAAVSFSHLHYDRSGGVIEDDFQFSVPDRSSARYMSVLLYQLEFSPSPDAVFLGEPFSNTSSFRECDASGRTCRKQRDMIWRWRLLSSPDSPGLLVTLRAGTVLPLQSRNSSDNQIVTGHGCQLFIEEIDYLTDESQLTARLRKLDLIVQSGNLRARGAFLRFGSGSRILVNTTRVHMSGESRLIEFRDSSATLSVGAGSSIEFGNVETATARLGFADGTTATLVNLRYEASEDGTELQLGAGSELDARLDTAIIPMGTSGWLQLNNSNANVRVSSALWNSTGMSVRGILNSLNANAVGGMIRPNPYSELRIANGTLVGTGLEFDSHRSPIVRGKFSQASLALQSGSRLSFRNRIAFTLDDASLIANNTDEPLRLEEGFAHPRGQVQISASFSDFANGRVPSLNLTSGSLDGVLRFIGDGRIGGSGIKFSASGHIASSTGGDIPIQFAMNNANVISDNGQAALEGAWNITLAAGVSFTFTTPFVRDVPDSNDARLFPLRLQVELPSAVIIGGDSMKISDGTISASAVTREMSFLFRVLDGSGEYRNRDDPSQGTVDSCNECRIAQEAARDKILLCTAHIYLLPHTYNASARVQFSLTNGQPHIVLNHFNLGSDPVFHKDGCDAVAILSVVGAVFGFLIAGPCGAAAVGVAGGVVGDNIEDRLRVIITERILATISSRSFEFGH